MTLDIPLTPDEIKLAKKYVVHGEAALLSAGLTPNEVSSFLNRYDIQYFLKTLYKDFEFKDSRWERVQFYALSELEKLMAQALSVIARSLMGITSDMTDLPPSGQQYKAAVDLLDRLGVKVNQQPANNQENPTIALNSINVNISEDIDSVSRERILTMVDMFVGGADKVVSTDDDVTRSVNVKKLPMVDDLPEARDRLKDLHVRKSSNGGKPEKIKKEKKLEKRNVRKRPSSKDNEPKNDKKRRGSKPSKKTIPGTSTQK